MELKEFTENIAKQFENSEEISPQTNYREHDEWCSLLALQVLAVIYKKYRVRLKAEEMRTTHTIEELYQLVKSKL